MPKHLEARTATGLVLSSLRADREEARVKEKRNEDGGEPLCALEVSDASERMSKSIVRIGFRRCPSQSILRKEVIQPQVPLRLPCYDFTPVADPTVVGCLLAVSAPPSGRTNSHGVTGGVYKARERIHRGMLIRDY
jgi:hypothetical protein